MTPGPDNRPAAARGHFRAAHADREHVIAVLKAAFVQGQLTKDDFDARVGRALVSRTYADLTALTADIPSELLAAGPLAAGPLAAGPLAAGPPPGEPVRTLTKAACRAAVCLLAAVALAEGAFLAGSFGLLILAFMAVMAASGFLGYGVVDSWHQRRARAQPPSRPGQGGQELEGGRHGRTGRYQALPGTRADQTRADLRADASRLDRSHLGGVRAPRTIRPAPGLV